MTHDECCKTILRLRPKEAALMVYQWVKTDFINCQEFAALYPLIDLTPGYCEGCGVEVIEPTHRHYLCDNCKGYEGRV